MRKLIFILTGIFLIGILVARPSKEQAMRSKKCIPVAPITKSTIAFQPGESLEYTVHYKWGLINSDVAKGYATLDTTLINGEPVFKARVHGKTAKFYDIFFKVREDFVAWFKCRDLTPILFTRDTKEGGYYAKDQYVYKWGPEPYIDANLMSKNKGQRNMQLKLNNCTLDFVNLLYKVRNIDMTKVKPNDQFVLSFALGSKVDDVLFTYLGKDIVSVTNYGSVRAHKFTMQLTEGEQFNANTNMYLWFSDDDNRIPLKFKAPIKVGVVTGRITSYSNLKHPFATKMN